MSGRVARLGRVVIGASAFEKRAHIERAAQGRRVFYVGDRAPDGVPPERAIGFDDVVLYKHFYPWLREIDEGSLLVLDEPLRQKDRGTLHYNCIRHYAAQSGAVLVLSTFPILDDPEDFAILYDFATKSRWRRSALAHLPLDEIDLVVHPRRVELHARDVPTTEKECARIEKRKRALVDGIGLRDPHTIPRNLYLETGKLRAAAVRPGEALVGRNNRLKLADFATFREAGAEARTVFELCHEHLVFRDWLARRIASTDPTPLASAPSDPLRVEVLVADAKIDRWYFTRHTEWTRRLDDAYAALRR